MGDIREPLFDLDLSDLRVDAIWQQAKLLTPDTGEIVYLTVMAVKAGWGPESLAERRQRMIDAGRENVGLVPLGIIDAQFGFDGGDPAPGLTDD